MKDDEMINFVELYWYIDDGNEDDWDFREFQINSVIPWNRIAKIDFMKLQNSKFELSKLSVRSQLIWKYYLFKNSIYFALNAPSNFNILFTLTLSSFGYVYYENSKIWIQFRCECEKLIENSLFTARKCNNK